MYCPLLTFVFLRKMSDVIFVTIATRRFEVSYRTLCKLYCLHLKCYTVNNLCIACCVINERM